MLTGHDRLETFMEGMVLHRVVAIQRDHLQMHGLLWKLDWWVTGLVIKLLEVTYGQWLYRNMVVTIQLSGNWL